MTELSKVHLFECWSQTQIIVLVISGDIRLPPVGQIESLRGGKRDPKLSTELSVLAADANLTLME